MNLKQTLVDLSTHLLIYLDHACSAPMECIKKEAEKAMARAEALYLVYCANIGDANFCPVIFKILT